MVAALIAYTFVAAQFSNTDHYWLGLPVTKEVSQTSTSSHDDVDNWLRHYSGRNSEKILRVDSDRKPVLVVVCASGGGIEAAAWTAKVLTELQIRFASKFARSIRLISSTSGGSVGSLFFVQSFFNSNDAPKNLDQILAAAETQSLDATGWGLVYPDFARLLAPSLLPFMLKHDREIDRGWALEQALRVALRDSNNQPIKMDTPLSKWREKVNEGLLPGTVFNAMLVESGNPLLLSSTDLPLPEGSETVVFGENDQDASSPSNRVRPLEKDDISVVTAARLSASFPYVSPVARGHQVDAALQNVHVADGGYYDNYGITVAVEWLNDIVKRHRAQIGKIALIEIDAFPEEENQALSEEKKPGSSADRVDEFST